MLLLFLVLELGALHYYAGSTLYTKATMLSWSNRVLGGAHSAVSGIGHFFVLGRENRALTQEVARLRDLLEIYGSDSIKAPLIPDIVAPYQYIPATVIGNSTTKQENYITLNKGMRDGVEANMAVITPQGEIVGYVLACSEKFAVCASVLNTGFRTSGKFSRADYVGSVKWQGISPEYVTLMEIPKYAEIIKGDTIVTSNYSSIFPPGVVIGTVDEWKLDDQTYSFNIKVKLTPRISSLREVLVVRYMDAAEREALEQAAKLPAVKGK